jgi:hypothetical protein
MSADVCGTCGKAHDDPMASICSSDFHCCRVCTWKDGMIVTQCQACKEWCEKTCAAFLALKGHK